ncbi:MAG: hypothetical protein IJG65_05750 [Synergistaceae bacterium]|nr:hypothetical protein [Synergistaceae bacterium]
MKKLKLLALLVIVALLSSFGTYCYITRPQERAPESIMSNAYYRIHASIYERMPRHEGGIVFLGDSITDYVKFNEIFPELQTHNRGIAGDNTLGVLSRLDEVISLKPAKLFLLIGTNDIVYGMTTEQIASNIREIIRRIQEGSASTKIYLETLLPTNSGLDPRRPKDKMHAINAEIKTIAGETGCELLDLYSYFVGSDDELPLKYTVDGLHMNGEGVMKWAELLGGYLK